MPRRAGNSASRAFVYESLHGAVLEALVEEVEPLPVGLSWQRGNEVGSIVSARRLERVMGFMAAPALGT